MHQDKLLSEFDHKPWLNNFFTLESIGSLSQAFNRIGSLFTFSVSPAVATLHFLVGLIPSLLQVLMASF